MKLRTAAACASLFCLLALMLIPRTKAHTAGPLATQGTPMLVFARIQANVTLRPKGGGEKYEKRL